MSLQKKVGADDSEPFDWIDNTLYFLTKLSESSTRAYFVSWIVWYVVDSPHWDRISTGSFCPTISCKPRPTEVCLRERKVPLVTLNIKSLVEYSAIRPADSEVRWLVSSGERRNLKNSMRSVNFQRLEAMANFQSLKFTPLLYCVAH